MSARGEELAHQGEAARSTAPESDRFGRSRPSPAAVALLERVGLRAPRSLVGLWERPPPGVAHLMYTAERDPDDPRSLVAALDAMDRGAHEPPEHLLPIFDVDGRSFAVVTCAPADAVPPRDFGRVLRWHLDDVPAGHQAALLDDDALAYAESLEQELGARQEGLDRMRELAAGYDRRFTRARERPKPYVVRPMQLASQNVVVGYAAVAHDTDIDGERAELWQTCEAPHLATHEANRALAAVLLCDAFQNGGTMEIRFDGSGTRRRDGSRAYQPHPEGRVPAALRRFARSRGVEIGAADPAAIVPAEARLLFLAVTPMSPGLRERVEDAVSRGVASPERLCFSLLMPVWRAIELDFLLGCSARTASILTGGADPWARASRMAEAEACRAAVLVGMYHRRLDSRDAAAGTVRTFEDNRQGVTWELLAESGAVRFRGVRREPLPWSGGSVRCDGDTVIVLPRAHPVADDVAVAHELARRDGCPAVIVTAADGTEPADARVPVLRAPDRVGELDLDVAGRLTKARGVRT